MEDASNFLESFLNMGIIIYRSLWGLLDSNWISLRERSRMLWLIVRLGMGMKVGMIEIMSVIRVECVFGT